MPFGALLYAILFSRSIPGTLFTEHCGFYNIRWNNRKIWNILDLSKTNYLISKHSTHKEVSVVSQADQRSL